MKTLTTSIEHLLGFPRKQVLSSLIGSFNMSFIGYVRGHIRASELENISAKLEVPTLDDYNEGKATEAEQIANRKAIGDMGFEEPIPPLDIARYFATMRAWAAVEMLSKARYDKEGRINPYDVPQSIADSIKWQLSKKPVIDQIHFRQLAQATGIDKDVLIARHIKLHDDDLARLVQQTGQILNYAEEFHTVDVDDGDAEQAYDLLPPHLKYKVMTATSNALGKAYLKSVDALLQRRSSPEALSDMAAIKANQHEVVDTIEQLMQQYSSELDGFIERGGDLPEVRRL